MNPKEDLENHWLLPDLTLDAAKYHIQDVTEYINNYWLPLGIELPSEPKFELEPGQYDHNKLILELRRLSEHWGDD